MIKNLLVGVPKEINVSYDYCASGWTDFLSARRPPRVRLLHSKFLKMRGWTSLFGLHRSYRQILQQIQYLRHPWKNFNIFEIPKPTLMQYIFPLIIFNAILYFVPPFLVFPLVRLVHLNQVVHSSRKVLSVLVFHLYHVYPEDRYFPVFRQAQACRMLREVRLHPVHQDDHPDREDHLNRGAQGHHIDHLVHLAHRNQEHREDQESRYSLKIPIIETFRWKLYISILIEMILLTTSALRPGISGVSR